jgi:hypothetical protein
MVGTAVTTATANPRIINQNFPQTLERFMDKKLSYKSLMQDG